MRWKMIRLLNMFSILAAKPKAVNGDVDTTKVHQNQNEVFVHFEIEVPATAENIDDIDGPKGFLDDIKAAFPVSEAFRACVMVTFPTEDGRVDPTPCKISSLKDLEDLKVCVESRKVDDNTTESSNGVPAGSRDALTRWWESCTALGTPTVIVWMKKVSNWTADATRIRDHAANKTDLLIMASSYGVKQVPVLVVGLYNFQAEPALRFPGKPANEPFATYSNALARNLSGNMESLLSLCSYTVKDADCYFAPLLNETKKCTRRLSRHGGTKNPAHTMYWVSDHTFEDDTACDAPECEESCKKHQKCPGYTIAPEANAPYTFRRSTAENKIGTFGIASVTARGSSECNEATGTALFVMGVVIVALIAATAFVGWWFLWRKPKNYAGTTRREIPKRAVVSFDQRVSTRSHRSGKSQVMTTAVEASIKSVKSTKSARDRKA